MAYAYCVGCGEEMDEPKTEEVLYNTWECAKCKRMNPVYLYKTMGDCVVELAERVAELEAKVEEYKLDQAK